VDDSQAQDGTVQDGVGVAAPGGVGVAVVAGDGSALPPSVVAVDDQSSLWKSSRAQLLINQFSKLLVNVLPSSMECQFQHNSIST